MSRFTFAAAMLEEPYASGRERKLWTRGWTAAMLSVAETTVPSREPSTLLQRLQATSESGSEAWD